MRRALAQVAGQRCIAGGAFRALPIVASNGMFLAPGGARGYLPKRGKNNLGGVDPVAMYGEDEPPERLPKGAEVMEIDPKEVFEAMAKDKAIKERRNVEFLKNYKQVVPDEYDPAGHIDLERYFAEHRMDYNDVPEILKGVSLVWEHIQHGPFFGEDAGEERFQRRNLQCRVMVNIDQFKWSPDQVEFLKKVVSMRYKPSKRELTIISRDEKSVQANFDRCKTILAMIIEEVNKRGQSASAAQN